ncbi:phosphatase PAP2 family protein [Streptomyces zagrosensis]|uniref:Membrane-associated phospholipid phosphatase n=1 Tax=Streptomyces zagrosensis TaxID=1042984 RepID=A0A7W9QCV9_9ACTN|nr:phosphatase PAP2 family protein [Streptomyces zagrosensis]MBB5937438.1 membrane-associated phospholipid phosphatase [Streptomyces zagrosensis]
MRTDDKLPQAEEHPAKLARPRMTRTRGWLLGSTLAVYVATVVGVLTTSWLVKLDWQVMLFRPYKQWPEFHTFLDYFVVLGQRGPTAVAVTVWLGWCCWAQRTPRPLLLLGTSLLLLNATVGAAKLGMGRLGPHYATMVGSNEMWGDGDIFPSGHTANAVVTWGVLAYLATTPQARRIASLIAAVVTLGVGMTTVYLGTHWVSDVLLGWAAGLLILLALPMFEAPMAWAEMMMRIAWARLRAGSLFTPQPVSPLAIPALGTSRATLEEEPHARERIPLAGRAARGSENWPHHPARPHTARSERTPVTPAGSRRPPHAERARSAPLGSASAPRGRSGS